MLPESTCIPLCTHEFGLTLQDAESRFADGDWISFCSNCNLSNLDHNSELSTVCHLMLSREYESPPRFRSGFTDSMGHFISEPYL